MSLLSLHVVSRVSLQRPHNVLASALSMICNPFFVCLFLAYVRFFFHEYARKIGIWVGAFIISPYLGAFLSTIISNYNSWRLSFWINFMIVGLAFTLVTILGEETIYDRENLDKQPPKPIGLLNYRVQMLTGIYGAKCKGRTTVWQSIRDLFYLLTRPYFLCLCCISPTGFRFLTLVFYFASFMWTLGKSFLVTFFDDRN